MNNKDTHPDDSPEEYTAPQEQRSFANELSSLINCHSQENGSNTPDFILAQYMESCLLAFNTATQQRETWYGRDARPSPEVEINESN